MFPIFLDFQGSTPCAPEVVRVLSDTLIHYPGNPHAHNIHGEKCKELIEKARGQVKDLLHAEKSYSVVFVSGATEANNLVLKGIAQYYKKLGKNHIITCQTEHKSILETCKHLEKEGFQITYLPVDKNGLISLKDLENAITDKTGLVTIMAVNNEIGVIQPIKEISKICKARKVIFHSDCAQAVGKIVLDMADFCAISISGHKVYAPQGIGAICLRNDLMEMLEEYPLFDGGGQEYGIRSGTTPTAMCVALGEACLLAKNNLKNESARILKLRDVFLEGLKKIIPELSVNGSLENRIPGNLSIRIPKGNFACKREDLEKFVSISAGSACSAGQPSHVLKALEINEEEFYVFRIGFGRTTTEKDIKNALQAFKNAFSKNN